MKDTTARNSHRTAVERRLDAEGSREHAEHVATRPREYAAPRLTAIGSLAALTGERTFLFS